jgi:Sulfotransferase family
LAVNPYVFIVGCPRSGTTLVKRILDAHPAVAITPETHWIPCPLRDGRGISAAGFVTEELTGALFEYFRFRRLEIRVNEVERLVEGGVSYTEFVSAVFDLYGERRGKQVVGDKTPPYVREIRLLHSLWPEARFIHVIRDGREVALSALDWRSQADRFATRFRTWAEDPLSTAALWWRRLVSIGRDDGLALGGGHFLELRYEALVEDPEGQSRRLCEFLDLPFREEMLRFHEGRTRAKPQLSSKKAWLPVTAGLRDWRSQMSPNDVEVFEAAAGDLLHELGYERAMPILPRRALAHAENIAAAVDPDLPTRGPLPVGVA